jgi:hypothetical protein
VKKSIFLSTWRWLLFFSLDGASPIGSDKLFWIVPDPRPLESHPSLRGERAAVWFTLRIPRYRSQGKEKLSYLNSEVTHSTFLSLPLPFAFRLFAFSHTARDKVREESLLGAPNAICVSQSPIRRRSVRSEKHGRRRFPGRVPDSAWSGLLWFYPLWSSLGHVALFFFLKKKWKKAFWEGMNFMYFFKMGWKICKVICGTVPRCMSTM